MTAAFQLGAFQFTGFQEGLLPLSGSGADLLHFLQQMQFARRNQYPRVGKPAIDDSAEVAATINALPSARVRQPTVPLSFRMVAPKVAAPVFVKLPAVRRHMASVRLKAASREYRDALELAEFREFMELIVGLEDA